MGDLMFTKIKPLRSKEYLDWVKTLECGRCLNDGGDAHHLIGTGNMGGMGTKAPDSLAMPLCRRCHYEMHHKPELHQDQWEMIARTLKRAFEQGVIEIV